MRNILKQRRGKTDQQLRIEELSLTIKKKTQEARTSEEQLQNLKRKKADLDHKNEQLKYTISDIELHQQADAQKLPVVQNSVQPPVDDQLTQWRTAAGR